MPTSTKVTSRLPLAARNSYVVTAMPAKATGDQQAQPSTQPTHFILPQ